MNIRSSKQSKSLISGFTLIELLVVISIIGLMSTIVLGSLNTARGKARDARRKEDLHNLQIALEVYYLNTGEYPADSGWCDSSVGITADNCVGTAGSTWPVGTGLDSLRTSGVMARLPVDPINNATNFYYYEPVAPAQTQFGLTCGSSTCAYILGTWLEGPTDRQLNPGCIATVPSMNYCISAGGALFGTP